jgi:hypothetical protein
MEGQVRLQMDNFRLFHGQQTAKRQLPFEQNGKQIKEKIAWASIFCFQFETAAYIFHLQQTNGRWCFPLVPFSKYIYI